MVERAPQFYHRKPLNYKANSRQHKPASRLAGLCLH